MPEETENLQLCLLLSGIIKITIIMAEYSILLNDILMIVST